MPVDAGALVEPAFALCGVDADGDDVLAAACGDVGDVETEVVVASLVAAHGPAVDEDGAVAEGAVEFQPEPAAGVGSGQLEGAAVPAYAILRIRLAQRFEAVAAVGLRVKGQFDGPVVRQVELAPARIAERHAGRPDAGAGFGEVVADAPVVAEVELPAEIQQQALTWRSGGGGENARRQSEQRSDEETLEVFHGVNGICPRWVGGVARGWATC